VSGIAPEVLQQIPSYVPGELPTVPDTRCRAGSWRWQRRHPAQGGRTPASCRPTTAHCPPKASNAAFGYNFEAASQEYVLVDERVVVDTATSVRSLIAVSEEPSASAVALVEPWACVESSYSTTNRRRTLAPGGRLLVVVDDGHAAMGLAEGGSAQ